MEQGVMNDFEGLLSILQENYREPNKEELLKLLLAIRKQVDWPVHKENIIKFYQKDRLRFIVDLLDHPSKSIVDVCLSILGNCCKEVSYVRKCFLYYILTAFNRLVKRFGTREDAINGRLYRNIGNLGQHKDTAKMIIEIKPKLIKHITDVLTAAALPDNKCTTEATIGMGVRCIRYLLVSTKVEVLVKTHQVLKPLGMLLIKYSADCENHKNIIMAIIKVIYDYSKFKCYDSILTLKNTEMGNALLSLCKLVPMASKMIVKILMNFIRFTHAQSDLPIPEVCDAFMKLLEEPRFMSESCGEYVDFVKCLCHLFDHPANRNADRCGKSIPLLIKTLKSINYITQKHLMCMLIIINTLNKCKFHNQLIIEQVKCDIIGCLVRKLKLMLGKSDSSNFKHSMERKRKYFSKRAFRWVDNTDTLLGMGLSFDTLRRAGSPSSSDDEDFFIRVSAHSPGSSSSTDSETSNDSSKSSISQFIAFGDLSESDSDDYSPVCTDVEDPSDCHESRDVMEDTETAEEINHTAFTNSNELRISVENLKVLVVTEIYKLLKVYTRIQPNCQQLINYDLLVTLVRCSKYAGSKLITKPDSLDIILKIFDNKQFLVPIINSNFIPYVFDLSAAIQHNSSCVKCFDLQHLASTILEKISVQAESEFGEGEITYGFLQGSEEMKQKLILIIPYVVLKKSKLQTYMLKYKGLNMLLKLLSSDDMSLKHRSLKVLCAMASKQLMIINPRKLLVGCYKHFEVNNKYRTPKGTSNLVTFVLDDGCTVEADREFLNEKSEYFSKMLSGAFRESNETEIKLQNVEKESLCCLLYLLQCNISKTEIIKVDVKLETLLDAISLSDRYLLTDLCVILTNCVERFHLSIETVAVIYQWSLESQTNILRIECVVFALVTRMYDSQRFKMFDNLFNLGCTELVIDDIQRLLSRYLSFTG